MGGVPRSEVGQIKRGKLKDFLVLALRKDLVEPDFQIPRHTLYLPFSKSLNTTYNNHG